MIRGQIYNATNFAYSSADSGAGGAAYCLQSAIENLTTCPERAKRVEWIETVVVPVVQRIERRFPKGKTALLHEFADVIGNAQMAPFKRAE